ncbi:glycosyltransferase family 39 protein, partial [Candidatus Woesearchaeota archaeon]|nr:glycosyltransferase family 39 protein [Candidatus Woesearchaeota archaeon]
MAKDELEQKREQLVQGFKKFFLTSEGSEDVMEKSESSERKEEIDLREKREQFVHFVKKHRRWIPFVLLALIIILGSFIRVQNFWLLKDAITGDYVSVDLDSHIYLKYAKEILATGTLSDVDYDRFVPTGAPTANYAFPAYVIYYLYKIMAVFSPDITINYADVVYPIIVFSIGLVFFFFLVRKLFRTRVALVSTFFLAIMPAFLQRTMGGSSDHDALGIMFMFASLYLLIEAWESKTFKHTLLWGLLAGFATGLTGLSWGAWKFIYLIFALFVLVQLFLNKLEERHSYLYFIWLVVSVITMTAWVPLFPLKSLFTSLTTGLGMLMVLVLAVDLLLYKFNLIDKLKFKHIHLNDILPRAVVGILISLVFGVVLVSILLGPVQLSKQATEAKNLLLHPMGKDRWELTVAEQHQPYFKEWVNSFGPNFPLSLPVLYTFFLIGLFLYLYNQLFKDSERRLYLSSMITILFLAIMFSRYSKESWLDGTTRMSTLFYFGSIIILFCLGIYNYMTSFYKNKHHYKQLSLWDSRALFMIIWAFFMLIAARGAIRLVFVYAPVVAALAGYGIVQLSEYAAKIKNK